MGFMSRKVLPVCGKMCICCPALRSRSRQPVKRYKKLLAEIFPKSFDGPPNERKIVKLCEYAAKNPFRIPKIVKYLEQRINKELRNEHIKVINVIMEAYKKLMCICKGQMVYFAGSILNVVPVLLVNTNVRVLGCHTLTTFIHSQADNTYSHNIESFVHKICTLAREAEEEHEKICLRASSLQCLSAMVGYMAQFSHVFANFDEIVHVTLDNYKADRNVEDDDGRGESIHNWVDEVVRCEGRAGTYVSTSVSPSHMITRPHPEKRDISLLTREETETPAVWTQICIQKMVELAKESTTMRRVLEPMFIYFDTRKHWEPRNGLAMVVLSDMAYFVENSGNKQLILAAIIRHLDHKNVACDPQTKSNMIQIASALAQQLRARAIVPDIGIVSDMCRHLKKSLQPLVDFVGQQKPNTSTLLQNAIEDCLLEITRGVDDARPLFDLMAITLEDLPPMGVVARATLGSMLILAHIISLASVPSHSQKIFPEALLVQLLRTMMHPDAEARIGAHQIFSAILIPSSRSELSMLHSGSQFDARRWQCKPASAFASATALLEKLCKEKDGEKVDKHENDNPDDFSGSETIEEEWKQGWIHKKLPNLFKLNSSIIDKTTGSNVSLEPEPNTIQLSEDQTVQLLSAFWMQASLSDNVPSNFEAISRSFSSTLISSRPKNSIDNIVIRFFQLPLSLRKLSLDPIYEMLPPSCQRLLFTLATSMLMFAAKIYQIPNLNDFLSSVVRISDDQYLSIGDDLQLYVKPQAVLKEFGSATDHEAASHTLFELREALQEPDKVVQNILVENLSRLTKLDTDDLAAQLSEVFTPDDAFLFGPQSILDFDHLQMASLSKELLSFDEEFQANSTVDEDSVDPATESSVHNYSSTMPRTPNNSSLPHIISAGQLIESTFEVAGQVAGSSISTSPLPYSAMARQCEALGTCTRKKLSSWLAHETTPDSDSYDNLSLTFHGNSRSAIEKITNNVGSWESIIGSSSTEQQPWSAMKLPPASPFDNFMKAARF